MQKILTFFETNVPWIGFLLMAIVGGIVAHIKGWEAHNPEMTVRQHLWAVFRRTIMASLAGIMWYFIMLEYGWTTKPFAYVGAALVGLFAPEFFDFLWDVFKSRISRKEEK